ncbi:MAG: hypothetical protein ACM3PT_11325 [Deltaproteobacteria bacterium]
MQKPPLINCHTHIFTGFHVPPYLAKTFIPFPFHFLLNLNSLVRLFRKTGRIINKIKYGNKIKKWEGFKVRIRLYRKFYNPFFFAAGVLVGLQFIFIVYRFYIWLSGNHGSVINLFFDKIEHWLSSNHLLIPDYTGKWQILAVVLMMLLLPSTRNLLKFFVMAIAKIPQILLGPVSAKMLVRYWNIVKFANYKDQYNIFKVLASQYPDDTRFVILPMDMSYMNAGKPPDDLDKQLEDLANIKKRRKEKVIPFIFADPRRIKEDKKFFSWYSEDGKVILNDCKIKTWFEQQGFGGIKIYPPLGYYPFDEELLPLWKYAADHKIPVTAHSSKGPIHYRGSKKKEWNRHPVFLQSLGNNKSEPLLLPEISNIDFTANFTHPLNYLCLLNEKLLTKIVSSTKKEVRELFGFTGLENPLKYDLNHLKICFAHFAGEEQWIKFLEHDRDNYSHQIFSGTGIEFLLDKDGKSSEGKAEQIWKYADWFSIIASLMLQYPNVYADISYIAANPIIISLLKNLLGHPVFSQRILFGSDFYVVRNHKSDRQILTDIQASLTEKEFDQIARFNPRVFLNL